MSVLLSDWLGFSLLRICLSENEISVSSEILKKVGFELSDTSRLEIKPEKTAKVIGI